MTKVIRRLSGPPALLEQQRDHRVAHGRVEGKIAHSAVRRVIVALWILIVPFFVYATPYAVAKSRGTNGLAVATFTVDEALYLTEARALAEGRPPNWNPWTREFGSSRSKYRHFAGALIPAAIWWRIGGDPTMGLGVAAGACAALTSLITFLILRRLVDDVHVWTATALAPLAILVPFDAIGTISHLALDPTNLAETLPLGRPFTSQWGVCVFALGLLCVVRVLEHPRRSRIAALIVSLMLELYTFPYAVPLTLGVHALLVGLSTPSRPWRDGWWPLACACGALVLLAPWAASGTSFVAGLTPLSEEAARFGGSGVMLLMLVLAAALLRSAVRRPMGLFLPACGLMISAGRVSDVVFPAGAKIAQHVNYLGGIVTAWLVLGLIGIALRRWRPPLAYGLAAACGVAAVVWATYTTAAAYRSRDESLSSAAAWASMLAALPLDRHTTLLVEGESNGGPGSWAGLYSRAPVFYAALGEHAPSPSFEDRVWRRAWYHYWRGLSAEDIDRQGLAVAESYPRFIGAGNRVPALGVMTLMRDRLAQVAFRTPEALAFLRGLGRIVCVESAATPTFQHARLAASLALITDYTTAGFHVSVYEAR